MEVKLTSLLHGKLWILGHQLSGIGHTLESYKPDSLPNDTNMRLQGLGSLVTRLASEAQEISGLIDLAEVSDSLSDKISLPEREQDELKAIASYLEGKRKTAYPTAGRERR